MAAKIAEPNPQLIQSIEWMSTETFARHMEVRHPEPLADMPVLWFPTDYVKQCYRAFHRQLHKLYPNLTHYHEEN